MTTHCSFPSCKDHSCKDDFCPVYKATRMGVLDQPVKTDGCGLLMGVVLLVAYCIILKVLFF